MSLSRTSNFRTIAWAIVVASASVSSLGAKDFDHTAWSNILKAAVSDAGWVDYRLIKRRHGAELRSYLRALGNASISKLATSSERKAFWINAYNAICIQKLIDHKLPKEVPHAVFFGKNIFKESTYRVAGKVRSLDDIEHGILRKKFKDNRVHAALVCGASSCPRLRSEAYTGANIDKQLDEESRRWVRDGRDKKGRRKNYVDKKNRIYYASKIFDWFEEDFGDSEAGILQFHKRFASDDVRKFLETNRVRLKYLDYDWKLNSK